MFSSEAIDPKIIKKCGVTIPNRMIFISKEFADRNNEIIQLLFYITLAHEIIYVKKFIDLMTDETKNILATSSPRKEKNEGEANNENPNPIYRNMEEDTGDFFENIVIGFHCQKELGNDFAKEVLEDLHWENNQNTENILHKYEKLFENMMNSQNYEKLKDNTEANFKDIKNLVFKKSKLPESRCLHLSFENPSEEWKKVIKIFLLI